MLQMNQEQTALLYIEDPDPVDIVNSAGASQFVLTCEHAGRQIPARLGDLGLPPTEMDRHIALDLGAAELAQGLSERLNAPIIMQRYSRLVIDCNRPLGVESSCPVESDGTPIPANRALSVDERKQRGEEIHAPFHRAISEMLDRHAREARETILVSVHSFAPRLRGGAPRPWHLGALSNRDPQFATEVLGALQDLDNDLCLAHNEPYTVSDTSDYTIPVHGERRNLPHALIEVRNDLLVDPNGLNRWVYLLARALNAAAAKVRKEAR